MLIIISLNIISEDQSRIVNNPPIVRSHVRVDDIEARVARRLLWSQSALGEDSTNEPADLIVWLHHRDHQTAATVSVTRVDRWNFKGLGIFKATNES